MPYLLKYRLICFITDLSCSDKSLSYTHTKGNTKLECRSELRSEGGVSVNSGPAAGCLPLLRALHPEDTVPASLQG